MSTTEHALPTVTPTHAEIPLARLTNDGLVFAGDADKARALRHGVFYVQHHEAPPESLERFAHSFYRPDAGDGYTGFREREIAESVLGFEDRPEQVEQLQLERALWGKYLPPEVVAPLWTMHAVSDAVVTEVFRAVGIPRAEWPRILGRDAGRPSLEYCIFNHFRSTRPGFGFTPHTDSGFITLVHSRDDALEGNFDGAWQFVRAREDAYLAILGDTMEALTRHLTQPVGALLHRVRATRPTERDHERVSICTYVGPRFDMDMYAYRPGIGVGKHVSFREFSIEKAAKLGYQFHEKVK